MSSLLLAVLLAGRAPPPPKLTPVNPFLPVVSAPWAVQITAFALPTPKPTWWTEGPAILECAVQVVVQPDASLSASAGACPAPMVEDALVAARLWRFAPVDVSLAQGGTTAELRFLATLVEGAAPMVTATVDPGADHTALAGPPGLSLVHRAYTTTPMEVTLSRAQKKDGLLPGDCHVTGAVSAQGVIGGLSVGECPTGLRGEAKQRVANARWLPRTVDGAPTEDSVAVVVRFVE